ncbi:cytoplasmic dynein 1 light intermediate chain 2 isoform X1 [Hippoglossus hippoglossus]|uniref:cytoplasmic dynein 1 light intermediate chain 2 isoform X1 n=1 Tax=Hippoglossus hippoglossus TaxID=8267 RepID=UPI00148DE7F2|nr:cytoplasmic dynein 1 light intermediate chain 2 isoform X1 [Hippoglossus hippoglossus]XP_035007926.2 cytoplasmic dynein 1 light intermediate chain 2 isoform X1 [Hippoglossus stenolepis]
MAPVLEKQLPGAAGAGDNNNEDEEGQTLWTSILSEVSTRSTSKLPSGKHILLFGEDGSGKTSLMAKLQGADHNKKGRGLEYLYLSVHDEDRDDLSRCNVWILDGDVYHKGLLKFAVSAQSLPDCLAVFVVDMSRPWTIMDSLQKWASVLRDHVDKLRIPPENMREMEQRMVKAFQEYTEPEDTSTSSPQRRAPTAGEDEAVVLPLGDNTLTYNLGIPVLIACTKCDSISILEKEHDYREEHFDFIQSNIRRFCLQYGAGLIYTSVKEEKNLDLLYKYIVHKIYDFQFTTPALVVEKDAVFIPSGWDNEKKIGILHENFTTVRPEDPFEDFITKPPVRKLIHDKEINAEDEQVFLMKQQSLLAKQPATPTRGATESPGRPASASPRPAGRAGQPTVTSGSPMTAVKKPDPNMKAGAANEGVLANFFNSLLSKKTGSPGSPGSPGAGAVGAGGQGSAKKTVQKPGLTDVQAELDRMTRKQDSMVSANNIPPPTENEA